MFTGLVRAVGRVAEVAKEPDGMVLTIETDAGGTLEEGSSISVLGCCQTVIAASPGRFSVRAMDETLRCTTFGALRAGDPVNLEPSLRVGDELGGHWVLGHVDGVAEVVKVDATPGQSRVEIELPAALARFVAPKGSVAIDGVSLTVGEVEGRRASVYLIPYTLEHTVASNYRAGTRVNVEADVVARYMARIVEEKGR